MSTTDRVHDILMGLAKRKRSGRPQKLPLVDEDGRDISAVDGVDGTFGVTVRDAGLTQQCELVRIGISSSVREDGNRVVETRPAPALEYMLDEQLLVSARIPVVNDDGELGAVVLSEGWKDAGEAFEILDKNMDFPLAVMVVTQIFEHYGIGGSETDEVAEELGNLPTPLESEEASTPL